LPQNFSFSGGVDSVLVAVALHLNLPLSAHLVLVNVSFSQDAPDRLQANRAFLELQRLYGTRKWKLVDVVFSTEDAMQALDHVRHCIYPNDNVMDITIATVLWFACQVRIRSPDDDDDDDDHKAKSCVNKVMFTGLGADELFAGYARHIGKWYCLSSLLLVNTNKTTTTTTTRKHVGSVGLSEELRHEIIRIGYRNNGRDDRVAGYWSLETRHIFLDRDLVEFALSAHVSHLADLTLSDRQGGKLVLREILRVDLGFSREIWDAPKKAMQFGSRVNHVFRSVFGKANGQDKMME
jgi:asparagine synthetase B (glutamine-hydrolysing)